MSLIVELGGGDNPAANAYADLGFANAHHALRGRDGWAEASEAARIAAILAATEHLDSGFRWKGTRKHPSQPLAWPRRDARDEEGALLTLVPDVVRRACAELALRALSAPLAPDIAPGGQPLREKAGEVEIAYAPGASPLPRHPAIERMLAGLVRPPEPLDRA